MSDEIYILKDDLVKYCEKIAGVGESYFDKDFVNEFNKIIEQAPIFKEKYINRDIIDLILDVAFDYTDHFGDEYDEIADNLKTFPSVRFVNTYEKEMVYREDIISTFKDILDYEGITPGTPDYDEVMSIVKSVPVLKMEV